MGSRQALVLQKQRLGTDYGWRRRRRATVSSEKEQLAAAAAERAGDEDFALLEARPN